METKNQQETGKKDKKSDKKIKKTRWIRFRHLIVADIVKLFLRPYMKIVYRVRIDKLTQIKKEPYLILYNHQTPADQFMLGLACPKQIYYVATEDIFSMGFISRVIAWGAGPIPIKKNGNDMRAVKNCMRVAKEGGSIAIAPEGNRTYSGETCRIKPSIVKLVRALKLPIAFFVFEGGYGIKPRWSDVKRGGTMRLRLHSTVGREEWEKLSDEELYELICTSLYHDDSEYPCANPHKRTAEYLERLIYVCPECGMSEFESDKDTLRCTKCELTVRYTEDKNFVKDGYMFEFGNVRDWYRYQEDHIRSLKLERFYGSKIYEDKVKVYKVIPYKKKEKICGDALLEMYGDKLSFVMKKDTASEADGDVKGCVEDYDYKDISAMAICGRNKLNIYLDGEKIYQIRGSKRFNAVKYLNIYHRYRNINRKRNYDNDDTNSEKNIANEDVNGLECLSGGKKDAEFLGL